MERLNLTGQRFERVVVINYSHQDKHGKSQWVCKCDCGTVFVAGGSNIKKGNTNSCGCYAMNVRTKHGKHSSRIYSIWADMKTRCDCKSNEYYHRYGGRGITYQKSWSEFEGFLDDMFSSYSDELTLERVDPNGPYSKTNCRWATKTEQARNKGMSSLNKTGVTGVHVWIDRKNGAEYYVASALSVEGKAMSRHFSIKKYGKVEAFRMACECRAEYIKLLNTQGAGYGEKHGQK